MTDDRKELAEMFCTDAWRAITDERFQVHFVEREFIAGLKYPDTIYSPHGMIPPTLDDESGTLDVTYCLDMIVEQTATMDETEFLRYLRYWVVRMNLRLTKEVELEGMQDGQCLSRADDLMLEEMVELDMERLGAAAWWKDLA